jgi:hypothetical protein
MNGDEKLTPSEDLPPIVKGWFELVKFPVEAPSAAPDQTSWPFK